MPEADSVSESATVPGSLENSAPPAVPTDGELKNAIEIWKQIISVQMHFNDIEMRIRNLYVTVLLGVVAATGWVVDKKLSIRMSEVHVHYAVAILVAAVMSSYLFYFMDRYWYHQLLRGQGIGSSGQALGSALWSLYSCARVDVTDIWGEPDLVVSEDKDWARA
jgi:hypothetical protein